MSAIVFKDEGGNIKIVVEARNITLEDIDNEIAQAQGAVREWEEIRAQFVGMTTETIISADPAPTPVVAEAEVVAPIDTPVVAPVDNLQPVPAESLQATANVNGEEVLINGDGTVNVQTEETTVSIDTTSEAPVTDSVPPITIQ